MIKDFIRKNIMVIGLIIILFFNSAYSVYNNFITIDSNGNVTITGDVTYDFRHLIAIKDSIPVYTMPNVNRGVYSKFTPGFTTTENDGYTFQGDSITIITPGDYFCILTSNFHGNLNDDYKFNAYINNVLSGQCGRFSGDGNNNYSEFCWFWYFFNLSVGDRICFKISNQTANNNPVTTYETKLYIRKEPEH